MQCDVWAAALPLSPVRKLRDGARFFWARALYGLVYSHARPQVDGTTRGCIERLPRA